MGWAATGGRELCGWERLTHLPWPGDRDAGGK